jgi:hypothetical protein
MLVPFGWTSVISLAKLSFHPMKADLELGQGRVAAADERDGAKNA